MAGEVTTATVRWNPTPQFPEMLESMDSEGAETAPYLSADAIVAGFQRVHSGPSRALGATPAPAGTAPAAGPVPAPTASDPWASMTPQMDPAAAGGYLSSGELLAWLATVGGNTYGEMRRQMVTTEQRKDLQEDLNSLKSVIEEVEGSKDLGKLEARVNELLTKYAGTEFETRVNALLGERSALLAGAREAIASRNAAAENSTGVGREGFEDLADDVRNDFVGGLASWRTDIDAKVDALGTEEQLALIRIQELNSQVTQATQLASNILAAQDQAASAAIMNIKA